MAPLLSENAQPLGYFDPDTLDYTLFCQVLSNATPLEMGFTWRRGKSGSAGHGSWFTSTEQLWAKPRGYWFSIPHRQPWADPQISRSNEATNIDIITLRIGSNCPAVNVGDDWMRLEVPELQTRRFERMFDVMSSWRWLAIPSLVSWLHQPHVQIP